MKQKSYFTELMQSVLDERKLTYRSLRTAAWEKNISKRTFEYFADIYAEDVNEKVLNRFFSYIRIKDNGDLYSDKYLKAVYSIVKAATNKAFIKGFIKSNPFEYGITRPKGKPTISKSRYIDLSDLKILLNKCQYHKRLKFVLPLLLMTGLRVGELLGLCWSDIDFDNQTIKIEREVSDNFVELPNGDFVKQGVRIAPPKTLSSIRTIPVSEQVINIFRQMLEYRDLPENAEWKARIEQAGNLNLCFPNGAGKLTNYTTLYDTLKDFLREIGLEDKVTFHKFRHNFATDLLEADVDVTVISQLLGHSSIETTVNTYIFDNNMDIKKKAIRKQSRLIDKKYF